MTCGNYGDTVDINPNLDFGTLRVTNSTAQAGITVTTGGSYSSPVNIINSSGQTAATLDFHSGRRLISGTGSVNINNSSTTLSCTSNCSSKTNNCTTNVTNIVNRPTADTIPRNGNKDFYIGSTISIPENCGSGTFTGQVPNLKQNGIAVA